MGLPILILGKSGSGKSTSLRNLKDFGLINVLGKRLPFKNDIKSITTDDYNTIKKALYNGKSDVYVIDDCGYLMTNGFMKGHSANKSGGNIFDFYNSLADNFWSLIDFIVHKLPENKIVYLMMHEEKNEFGETKPKTIGKLLDEKVCVEGMFTIVLRAVKQENKYLFKTSTDGLDVVKTPIGLFDEEFIDNDLDLVNQKIIEYYEIGKKEK